MEYLRRNSNGIVIAPSCRTRINGIENSFLNQRGNDVEDEVDNDCYCGCRDHELDRSFDNLKDHEHDRHNNDQRSETHRNYPLVKDAPEGSVSIPSTDEPNRFFSQVDRATRNPRCDF